MDPRPTWKFLERRQLGRTGFIATLLGVGDLVDASSPEDEQVAVLRRALDAGLNVIDTAPSYAEGLSEKLVGRALEGRRDDVFVIDKIDFLDQPVATQVEASLQRLGLDSIELFVFHSVSTLEDWNALLAKGAGFDQLDEQRRAGRLCFTGISSHHPEVVLAAVASGRCDVVMFPLGPYCDSRYIDLCLPAARAAGVGTVCFKTFGAGKLLTDTLGYGRPLDRGPSDPYGRKLAHMSAEECVRFTLTLDPDVTLLGMSTAVEQDAAFASAANFTPLTDFELDEYRRIATRAVEGKGPVWWDPA